MVADAMGAKGRSRFWDADSCRPLWSLERLTQWVWGPLTSLSASRLGKVAPWVVGKMMPCLCLAPSWFPQMPLTFSIFLVLLWNSYDVVDSICSWSQVKPASGGKLEAFKGLVSTHVAHRPHLGVTQGRGFPNRQLLSTELSLISALFLWVGKPTPYRQRLGAFPQGDLHWSPWSAHDALHGLGTIVDSSRWFPFLCFQQLFFFQDPRETLKLKITHVPGIHTASLWGVDEHHMLFI